MPADDKNFKYVLLIGDIFSKYIEAVPMIDQTASRIIDAFIWEVDIKTELSVLYTFQPRFERRW